LAEIIAASTIFNHQSEFEFMAMQTKRGRALFTLTAVDRAIKAAQRAGLPIERVDLRADGTISILTTQREMAIAESSTEWDQAIGKSSAKVRS
jgi:hypothetical protein